MQSQYGVRILFSKSSSKTSSPASSEFLHLLLHAKLTLNSRSRPSGWRHQRLTFTFQNSSDVPFNKRLSLAMCNVYLLFIARKKRQLDLDPNPLLRSPKLKKPDSYNFGHVCHSKVFSTLCRISTGLAQNRWTGQASRGIGFWVSYFLFWNLGLNIRCLVAVSIAQRRLILSPDMVRAQHTHHTVSHHTLPFCIVTIPYYAVP